MITKEERKAIKDDQRLFLNEIEEILKTGNGIYQTTNATIFIGTTGKSKIQSFLTRQKINKKCISGIYVLGIYSVFLIINEFISKTSNNDYIMMVYREDEQKYYIYHYYVESSLSHLKNLYLNIAAHIDFSKHNRKKYYQFRTLWELRTN